MREGLVGRGGRWESTPSGQTPPHLLAVVEVNLSLTKKADSASNYSTLFQYLRKQPIVSDSRALASYRNHPARLKAISLQRSAHRSVIKVRIAAQIRNSPRAKVHDHASDPTASNAGKAMDHAILIIEVPRTINLGILLFRPASETKHCQRPLFITNKEALAFFNIPECITAVGITAGPLRRITVRPHEFAGVVKSGLDEIHIMSSGGAYEHAIRVAHTRIPPSPPGTLSSKPLRCTYGQRTSHTKRALRKIPCFRYRHSHHVGIFSAVLPPS